MQRTPSLPPRTAADFIRANTELVAPPLVPELRLHLAAESLPLWQRTEDELAAGHLPPPFWAFAWAGGQALARYLLDDPQAVAGRRVLDLGAGSGLCAIAAARAGAAAVTAADLDAFAATAIALNAAVNGVHVATTADDLLDRAPGLFEVALMGDLFYEQALAARALAWAAAAARAGMRVLAGDPGRTYFPAGRFLRLAAYDVPVSRELEDAEVKHTGVWALADAGGASLVRRHKRRESW